MPETDNAPAGADDITRRFRDLLDEASQNKNVLAELDDLARGNFENPYLPPQGGSAIDREYRALMDRAELPVCGLLIKAVSDRLSVEGVRTHEKAVDEELWGWWQYSKLDSRQSQVYADAMTYGNGYLSITLDEEGMPRMMPESPLALYAIHDPLDPLKVLEAVKRVGDEGWYYTAEAIYHMVKPEGGGIGWVIMETTSHPLGVCPIVRFANNLDSMGRSETEIKPAIPFQKRINQSVFTRMLLEAHTAWRQRWIAGIDVEKDGEGKPIPPFRMGVDKLLIAPDPDAKFGEFQASTTADLLQAVKDDLQHLAVVTQTPPTLFAAGSVSNISQESLAALEGGLTRKVESKQQSFGESFEYGMVLAAGLLGRDLGDKAHLIEMIWTNMELRSLAQRADAYVKLAAAGLPAAWLMEDILDMSPPTVERVLAAAQVEESRKAIAQAQAFGVTNGEPPNEGPPAQIEV